MHLQNSGQNLAETDAWINKSILSNPAQPNEIAERQVAEGSEIADSKETYETLVGELTSRFGPLLGGHDLVQALGYPNAAAFRQARRQGRLGVHVFDLPARRGKFALTKDVAVLARGS